LYSYKGSGSNCVILFSADGDVTPHLSEDVKSSQQ